jgi:hypothetical protein
MKLGSSLRAGKVLRLSDRLAEVCPETALMVASTLGVGVVDPTVALFSEMGQGNFKRRPAARLTLAGDRAVMR